MFIEFEFALVYNLKSGFLEAFSYTAEKEGQSIALLIFLAKLILACVCLRAAVLCWLSSLV